MSGDLPGGLDDLLEDDVAFYSPIVFTPQRGKEVASLYLRAAGQTFAGNDSSSKRDPDSGGRFHYTKSVMGGATAILEFETTMEGKCVKGIDIIRCNDEGHIIEFRAMIRPRQAVNLVHEQMAAILDSMSSPD